MVFMIGHHIHFLSENICEIDLLLTRNRQMSFFFEKHIYTNVSLLEKQDKLIVPLKLYNSKEIYLTR